jgi:teichuronic acid exporter
MQIIQALIEQLQALRQKLTAAIANLNEFKGDQSGWLKFSGFIDLGCFLVALNALARSLFAPELGIVAILLATHAIFRAVSNIFMEQVITPAIVKGEGKDLNQICHIAYRLNWLLALVLFILQGAIALPLARLYDNSTLTWLMLTLAFNFAIYPQGTICLALRQRYNQEQNQHLSLSPGQLNRLNQTQANLIGLAESSINYLAIAILVWSGLGVWAIVVAAFIASLIAQWLRRKSYFWRPNPKIKLQNWRSLFKLSSKFMNAPADLVLPLITVLEINLVYLLIGRAIGLETLGLFFIAINGGLMITLKIMRLGTVANMAELKQLSPSFRGLKQLYLEHYQRIALITIPLVVIQSTLAPFYIPLLFGDTWNPAITAVVVLLLSALPRPFAAVGTQLLTVTNRSQFNLYWRSAFLVIVLGAVIIGTKWQLLGVCVGYSDRLWGSSKYFCSGLRVVIAC